jgi:hypothetical protein
MPRAAAALALCAAAWLSTPAPAAGAAPTPSTYTVRTNRALRPSPAKVDAAAGALHQRLHTARLWPSGKRTHTAGTTRFRHVGAAVFPVDFAVAKAGVLDLDAIGANARVPDDDDDLVHVHGVVGVNASRRLTLFVHFDFPVGSLEALPLDVSYGAARPDEANVTIRFATDDGFVRQFRLDLALRPADQPGHTAVGFELSVVSDWRGVAVTRAMFDKHVVRKVHAIMSALVASGGVRR